jgi:photosystem II stability/assembly factor-like uncharacterized protein
MKKLITINTGGFWLAMLRLVRSLFVEYVWPLMIPNFLSTRRTAHNRVALLAFLLLVPLAPQVRAADVWTDFNGPWLETNARTGPKPPWPGGCSGVVVNRLSGAVTVKVVGRGLWQNSGVGGDWKRIDDETVSGRDETGWTTSVDQNSPERMASFSLDGSAGWTPDGVHWVRFTSLGRNWDYGSVDWSAAVPKTIIAARHETTPPGEVYATTDGGVTWNKLDVHLAEKRDKVSMVGALGPSTVIYGNGQGIQRSTDVGVTWKKVSDFNPQTRVSVCFRGRHYLGTATGLIVSEDRGAGWRSLGKEVSVWQGPFFGRDEREIVVVGEKGVFRSEDGGETWTRVAGLKEKLKEKKDGFVFTANWFGCYAWDPVRRVLYASAMGNPVFKLDL